MTRSFACLVLLLALLAPAQGFAVPPDGLDGVERAGRIGWDLVVLRPLGLVRTAVSLVGAAVAYPVAWAFDGQDHVTEFLVEDPIDSTFRRPLGDL